MSALRVFRCKSVLRAAFVWARRALNRRETAVSGPGQTENCVPRCRQELNGDELLLNIFGEDSRLTCELHRSCMVQPLAELYGGCMVVLTVS